MFFSFYQLQRRKPKFLIPYDNDQEHNDLQEVHMIHSYGVNACVIARKDAGTTQINS